MANLRGFHSIVAGIYSNRSGRAFPTSKYVILVKLAKSYDGMANFNQIRKNHSDGDI